MEFRPLSSDDLAKGTWASEVELLPDLWRDEDTRSVVGIIRGRLVAAGQIWRTPLHDDTYWIDVVVHPDCRRQGLGTRTVEHLCGLRRFDLPLQTRGYVDEPRILFADALGARTVQVVPPSTIRTERRGILRRGRVIGDGRSAPWSQVLAANAAIYEWTHASWSPANATAIQDVNAGLEEEIDFDATSIAVGEDGEIRALALAYLGNPSVITAEAVAPGDADGERLVEACVRRTLDVLAHRGVDTVEFDGHVSDPHFLPVWAKLQPEGQWFRLVQISARTVSAVPN